MSLEGRVALVTGGSRGIGAGIVGELAKAGADVAINYNSNREAAEKVAAELRPLSRRLEVYQADITSLDACRAMCERALADFGKIDILVNNGGIGSIHVGRPRIADTEPEQIQLLFDHHVMGSFYLCKLLLPQMRTLPRGDIIMISSMATSHYGANGGTYNIAKAGMEALAYTLAKEERENRIRVNIVAPGFIETDMARLLMKTTRDLNDLSSLHEGSPFGRLGRPSDIGAAVAFLCSEGASWITNQRLAVSGGGF